MKHISTKYRYLQDAITNQEVWLRNVGTKDNVSDGLDKHSESTNAEEHVDHAEYRAVGNYMQTCVHQYDRGHKDLMGEQKSTPAARGVNLITGHTNIVKDEKEILENRCRHRDALP